MLQLSCFFPFKLFCFVVKEEKKHLKLFIHYFPCFQEVNVCLLHIPRKRIERKDELQVSVVKMTLSAVDGEASDSLQLAFTYSSGMDLSLKC